LVPGAHTAPSVGAEPPLEEKHVGDSEAADVHHLTISDDATVLEGLRGLLAHHLRRSNVVCLSESQAELLEHHLTRLASYSQKIVHTIAFAQRVFSKGMAEVRPQEDQMPPQEPEELQKKRKPLRLNDSEILKMYSLAQQEAELEADWRGIDYMQRAVPQFRSHDGSSSARPSSRGMESGRRQERREAIELLGQAFAVSGSSGDPLAGELAERLVPVRRPRPCDDMLAMSEQGYMCCEPVPSSEDTDRIASNGETMAELAKVRQQRTYLNDMAGPPPQRVAGRDLQSTPEGSLIAQSEGGVFLTVSPADVRSWLDNRVDQEHYSSIGASPKPQMSIEVRTGTGDPPD
jgi:hypothetical protein